MKTIKRFGVSLEEDLLKKLDQLTRKHGFPNRSQTIRFLINDTLSTDASRENKEVAGCLALIFDHHKRDLITKSLAIQHDYSATIIASQHVHLDHHNCLEILALKGKATVLRELADRLLAIKGIKHGKLTVTAT